MRIVSNVRQALQFLYKYTKFEYVKKLIEEGCLRLTELHQYQDKHQYSAGGKGSHSTLFYGERFTIIRNLKDELETGAFKAMLKQLGITEQQLSDYV